ncbi:hypothetical protein BJY00DRAFT_291758 [Aspergillus carlsbadensis]|nr:hypothetical protein BJY00DRAFT_291758 [Aspergillus carlsbadensis]
MKNRLQPQWARWTRSQVPMVRGINPAGRFSARRISLCRYLPGLPLIRRASADPTTSEYGLCCRSLSSSPP